ncbi:MAG: hypothetical protein AB1705_05405 [Verrucomicrobiota bacterium]
MELCHGGAEFMSFLPIVERELRVAARRKSLYWARWAAALCFIGLGGVRMLSFPDGPSSAALSMELFRTLTEVAFFFCLGAGVLLTADCLSVEKRENTLGLLFLTDLKGGDVVLGKMAAHALTAFYGLLAIYPMLAVPLVIGGVSFDEFVRITLVLTNTFFFSLAAGVLVSALTQNEKTAMSGTLLFLMLAALVLPAAGGTLAAFMNPAFVDVKSLLPTGYAGLGFSLAYSGLYERAPQVFWQALAGAHALAWGFIGFAACQVKAEIREQGRVMSQGVAARARETRSERDARVWYRTKLLDENPMLWLAARDAWKPKSVWVALGILMSAWLVGLLAWGWDWLMAGTLPSIFLLHALLKLWVASEATHRLVEDHRSGALELMLSTPLTVKRIVQGQLAAIQRQFTGPILAVLVFDVGVLLLTVVAIRPAGVGSGFAEPFAAVATGVMIFFLLDDAKTIAVIGMQMGLRHTRADRAWLGAVTRVLIVPWLIWLLPVAPIASGGHWPIFYGILLLGGWVNAMINYSMRMEAEEFLRLEFRTAAAERFEAKKAEADVSSSEEPAPAAVWAR